MLVTHNVEDLLTLVDDPDAVVALTGALGVWAGCRQASRSSDLRYLAQLEASGLAECIEDNLPAFEGPGPAARVRALVAAARLACWSGPDPAAALTWLAEVVDAFSPPGSVRWQPPSLSNVAPRVTDNSPAIALIRRAYRQQPHAGLVAAFDLVQDVRRPAAAGETANAVSVALPLARQTDAEIALLTVRTAPGPVGLFPDVTAAPFLRYDATFHGALGRAWHAAHLPAQAMRWTLSWERTGNPVDAVGGESVGLAAVAALTCLCDRRREVPPGWVFTGAINETGTVESLVGNPLHGAVDLAPYRHKVVAADRRTLVLPTADHAQVAPFAERTRLRARLVPVAHLDEMLAHFGAVTRRAEPAEGDQVVDNPYDLRAGFGEIDAARFFGRERALAELSRRLAADRLVVLEGASGTGKTSLVKAGLLPALRRGAIPGSEHWAVAFVAIGPGPGAVEAIETVVQGWDSGDGRTGLDGPPQAEERLLIVDEIGHVEHPSWADPSRREVYDRLIVLAATHCRVLLTGRSGCCAALLGAPELTSHSFARSRVVLAHMTAHEVRRAVLGVAQFAGLVLEGALLDTALSEIAEQSAALPHLFTALHGTWRRRTGNLLTLAGYLAAGGVDLTVRNEAEGCASRLTANQQKILDQILARLVEVGVEEGDDRCRGCPLDELDALPFPIAEIRAVLDELVRASLLTIDDRVAALVHDSLLSGWGRLARSIEGQRAQLRAERQLLDDARRWQLSDEDPSFLYPGGRYRAARRVVSLRGNPPTALVGRFLAACAARRRRRRMTAAAAVALLVALVPALVIGPELWKAQRAADARRAVQTALVEIPSRGGSRVFLESHVVTIAQFQRCMADRHHCQAPERQLYRTGKPDDPMTDVTFIAADAYCSWLGRTLPTVQMYLDARGVAAIKGLDDQVKEWTRTQVLQPGSTGTDWQRGDPVERFLYFLNDKQALAAEPPALSLSTVTASKQILNMMNPRSGGVDVGFRCVKEGTRP